MKKHPGQEAIVCKGWLRAYQWLLLRRLSQLSVLLLFLLGPWFGLWWVKGNLNFSLTLGWLPLTDPYVLLQTLFAGSWPQTTALIGAGIVLAFYAFVGGRVYCAWVCPINPITDFAAWIRDRVGIRSNLRFGKGARYWLLATTLLVSALTGMVVWELVNPVSFVHRGIIFGASLTIGVILAVFLFDLFVMRNGWCGHICPVGAFYSLLGKFSWLRVSAIRRSACDDCMDCFTICPEPQVINPALKGASKGVGPVILSANCTNCGRCIDVCSKDVFRFRYRNSNQMEVVS